MKYDKEVLTINNILTALDNFDNKEEIINAIKQSLYDIETDWHNEEYLERQLQAYKDKEDKLREELLIWGEVINPTLQNKLLQILEGDK